ncbi:hypothetical protein BC835DRAFT_1272215 [Cytidiella melzeri]|nr:hypothetical protein BC835DRAFT_1272215 [Cytidiella melzeri]
MTGTEIWLSYHQASRANRPSTAQLIDLACHKLVDLEDVLDYIFSEGFVEPKYRPVSYWEKVNGDKVKGGFSVDELLQQGVGKCEETALRLVIADVPPAVWFSYHYTNAPASAPIVNQRVKLDALHSACASGHPKVAHLTNHIFQQGYLPKHLRSRVHWQGVCGKKVEEHADLLELLVEGEGVAEDKTLRLIIGMSPIKFATLGRTDFRCADDHFHVDRHHCSC